MPVGRVLLTTKQACPDSTETPSQRSPDDVGNRMLASIATSVSLSRRRAPAALLGWIGPLQVELLHLGPDVLVFLNSVKLLHVRIET